MTDSAMSDEKRILRKENWDVFLAQLDKDPEKAGAVYEQLRTRLITFFRCRGFIRPEEDADQSIDRMVRAASREPINNPMAYALGVGRYVALEAGRTFKEVPLDELEFHDMCFSPEPGENGIEKQLVCIEECASLLTPEDQELLFVWYLYEKAEKAQKKRQLAAKLGISLGALRVRACRIRARLRESVAAYMEETTPLATRTLSQSVGAGVKGAPIARNVVCRRTPPGPIRT